jgi:hypothetical protein
MLKENPLTNDKKTFPKHFSNGSSCPVSRISGTESGWDQQQLHITSIMIGLQHAVQLPRPPTIAFLSFSRFSSYSALSEGLSRLMSTVGSGPSSSEAEATVPCSQQQSTAMSSCRQVMPGHTISCQYKDLTNPAPIPIRILSSKAANIATSRSTLFSNAHNQGQEELAARCIAPLIMSLLPPKHCPH